MTGFRMGGFTRHDIAEDRDYLHRKLAICFGDAAALADEFEEVRDQIETLNRRWREVLDRADAENRALRAENKRLKEAAGD